MIQLSAYDILNNTNFTLNDTILEAIHLITLTIFMPKGSIPNMPTAGASFYNLLATEYFSLDNINNDIADTGTAFNYDATVIQLAQQLITNIDIQDVYVLVQPGSNQPMYIDASQINNIQLDTIPQLVKNVTITLGTSATVNIPIIAQPSA